MATHKFHIPKSDETLALVRALWNCDIEQSQLNLYGSYLRFYSEEVSLLTVPLHNKTKTSIEISISTQHDIVRAVRVLHRDRSSTRPQLRAKIANELFPSGGAEEKTVQNAMDLAIRISIMINVRERGFWEAPTAQAIAWSDDDSGSLAAFVSRQFHTTSTKSFSSARLPFRFTIPYMVTACGLRVIWTECLTDHLKVDQERRSVRIFHLKQCLADQLNGKGSEITGGPLLPIELLKQTIWSLNILFPLERQSTTKFLRKHQDIVRLTIQGGAEHDIRPRDLCEYSYWYRRLEDLLEVYESGPTNLKQYFAFLKSYERFNWVVAIFIGFVLAVLFGVIASIYAILSYKKASESLSVAREQLQLQQLDWDRQQRSPICPCS